MYKHKPKNKTDVRINGVLYKCNSQGVIELPDVYPRFNPIEKKRAKKAIE